MIQGGDKERTKGSYKPFVYSISTKDVLPTFQDAAEITSIHSPLCLIGYFSPALQAYLL